MGQIRTVADYVGQIAALPTGSDYVFRGQAQEWRLLPKIARERPNVDWTTREREVFTEFRRRAVPMLGLMGASEIELLGVAQHHGIPTRLLDWSRNALSALWFAVREPWDMEWTSSSTVYAFKLNGVALFDEDELFSNAFEIRRTQFFLPRHVTPRITAQEGLFSIHPFSKKSKKFVPLEKNRAYKDRLFKFEILEGSRKQIRAELRLLGVHAASVFPDLAGLAEFLTDKYDFKQRVVNMSAVANVNVVASTSSNIRKLGKSK